VDFDQLTSNEEVVEPISTTTIGSTTTVEATTLAQEVTTEEATTLQAETTTTFEPTSTEVTTTTDIATTDEPTTVKEVTTTAEVEPDFDLSSEQLASSDEEDAQSDVIPRRAQRFRRPRSLSINRLTEFTINVGCCCPNGKLTATPWTSSPASSKRTQRNFSRIMTILSTCVAGAKASLSATIAPAWTAADTTFAYQRKIPTSPGA